MYRSAIEGLSRRKATAVAGLLIAALHWGCSQGGSSVTAESSASATCEGDETPTNGLVDKCDCVGRASSIGVSYREPEEASSLQDWLEYEIDVNDRCRVYETMFVYRMPPSFDSGRCDELLAHPTHRANLLAKARRLLLRPTALSLYRQHLIRAMQEVLRLHPALAKKAEAELGITSDTVWTHPELVQTLGSWADDFLIACDPDAPVLQYCAPHI